MNKKMYNQPQTNAHQFSAQQVICTSPIINNDPVNGESTTKPTIGG